MTKQPLKLRISPPPAPPAPEVQPGGNELAPSEKRPLAPLPAPVAEVPPSVAPPPNEPESAVIGGIATAGSAGEASAARHSPRLILLCTGAGAVVIGAGILVVQFLVPFVSELRHPNAAKAGVDRDANVAVQAVQMTRSLAAASEARAREVGAVAAAAEGKSAASPAPAAVAPPAVVSLPGDSDVFYTTVLDYKVHGVSGGEDPRAFINGRLVRVGEIIDEKLGLRFLAVDTEAHVLVFSNAANVKFKKHY